MEDTMGMHNDHGEYQADLVADEAEVLSEVVAQVTPKDIGGTVGADLSGLLLLLADDVRDYGVEAVREWLQAMRPMR
jgi:hypothetical protein